MQPIGWKIWGVVNLGVNIFKCFLELESKIYRNLNFKRRIFQPKSHTLAKHNKSESNMTHTLHLRCFQCRIINFHNQRMFWWTSRELFIKFSLFFQKARLRDRITALNFRFLNLPHQISHSRITLHCVSQLHNWFLNHDLSFSVCEINKWTAKVWNT